MAKYDGAAKGVKAVKMPPANNTQPTTIRPPRYWANIPPGIIDMK